MNKEEQTMQKVKELWLSFRKGCYNNGYAIIAFFIPVILMIAAYISFDIWPFGEHSVLSLDLNAQYVFYFDYVHDVIGNGESLMYSWSRNLSGEFMGIIGYYLASPFNIIVWLFPRSMITEGLLFMILAKFGACGATFAVFAHRGKNLSKKTALLFAPMYAMCAYMVVQTMNPMWLDGVIILPLVVFGIESLVKHNRFIMLILSLTYAFISNFYIGFMIAIFTVIYYICYYFANAEYQKVGRTVIDFIKKGAFTGLCGITSALMSAFMLLPVYNSLQNGKFSFTTPDYTPRPNFDIVDMLQKLFPNTYDTVRMEGLPFIFCGSLTLIMAAGFFCCNKFSVTKRISAGVLLGLLTVSMYVRPIDMLWHGGQMPNWLPYRYSFMISFVLVMLAAEMFDEIKHLKGKTIGLITVLYIGLIIFIESEDTVNPALGDGGREMFDGISVALPAIFFIAVAGIIAYIAKNKTKKNKRLTIVMTIVLAGTISGELCYNACKSLEKMDTDIVYSTKQSYVGMILPLREKVEEIKANDDGFYRIEKNFFRSVNDPIAVNMYGLSHSSSTLNAKAIDMLGYFGFTSNGHYSRYSGNTPITADIFGVKYTLDCLDENYGNIKTKDDISVTMNDDALPILYLTENSVTDLRYDREFGTEETGGEAGTEITLPQYTLKADDVFDNQNMLLGAMTGNPDAEYFTVFNAEGNPAALNCTKGNFAGGHTGFTNAGSNASVSYRIFAPKDGDIYMYVPTDYEREVSVYANNIYVGILFESDNHNIKKLGTFKAGEEINVRFDLNRSDLYIKEPQFAMLDSDAHKAAVQQVLAMNTYTKVEKLSATHLKVTASTDKDRTLFTTIPYEKGWTVYVDGVAVTPETAVCGALMAIPLTAGEHTVELKFFSAGLDMGLICMVCGIVIFAALIVISKKLKAPVKLSKALESTDNTDAVNRTLSEETTSDDLGYWENDE